MKLWQIFRKGVLLGLSFQKNFVEPLMQLDGTTFKGLLRVFTSYVDLLINALPGLIEDEGNLEGCANKFF
ncbi:hypothetical protein BVC80_8763g6 [Macleaya cordata]|uniref:Uncharacterized protein n=1 Tax=Macleaya cordata TaxID=56857 RepID=A0A200QND8_MACCD|nr:hypothetical protein BVC80_8763g6 [Macleaya cordata]